MKESKFIEHYYEPYCDDSTIATKELQGFNDGRAIVLEGMIPDKYASYIKSDENSFHDSNHSFPSWLSSSAFYFKLAVAICMTLLLVSAVSITTGLIITAQSHDEIEYETKKQIKTQTNQKILFSSSDFPSNAPPDMDQLFSYLSSKSPSTHEITSTIPTKIPNDTSTYIASNEPSLLVSSRLPTSTPSLTQYVNLTTSPSSTPSIHTSIPSLHSSNSPSLLTSSPPSHLNNSLSLIPSIPYQTHEPSDFFDIITETSFYVLGDRYSGFLNQLEDQLSNLDGDRGEFLVHLGDFLNTGSCSKSDLEDYSLLLNASNVPVFVVVGDNEWNDCASSDSGRRSAMRNFRSVFGNYDSLWQHSVNKVTRKEKEPEFFSFIQRKVLFIGVHIVGGSQWNESLSNDKWIDHLDASLDWVQLQMFKSNGLYKVLVVFGNARPMDMNSYFFNSFKNLIDVLQVPSLYVFEGSKNKMRKKSESYWTMETQGNKFPFVVITADESKSRNPFHYRVVQG